jgi:hypothetical protein
MPHPEADTPFTPSAAHQQRIRVRAYHLWESEGRKEGHAAEYWERARELDALEHNPAGQLPNPLVTPPMPTYQGVTIEEAVLQENLGEFPSLFNEQGDSMPTPETREIAREFREGER